METILIYMVTGLNIGTKYNQVRQMQVPVHSQKQKVRHTSSNLDTPAVKPQML
jgi:hypothetical protein